MIVFVMEVEDRIGVMIYTDLVWNVVVHIVEKRMKNVNVVKIDYKRILKKILEILIHWYCPLCFSFMYSLYLERLLTTHFCDE